MPLCRRFLLPFEHGREIGAGEGAFDPGDIFGRALRHNLPAPHAAAQ